MGDSSYVDPSILDGLKCSICKNYLSIVPIYMTVTGIPICGRCPTPDDNFLQRNILYERAIEFQKFPCINRLRGCLEEERPAEMAKHENRCYYKKQECFTKPNTECKWTGLLVDLQQHFQETHPALIIKNGTWEADAINKDEQYYLMPFDDALFAVSQETDSRNSPFAILVVRLGSTVGSDEYKQYVLTLKNDKKQTYDVQGKIGQKIKVTRDTIETVLHSPTTVTAQIQIKNQPETEIQVSPTMNPLMTNSVDDQDLKLVECPICYVYMIECIYQCEVGHNICETCMSKQRVCPTCRAPFHKTRNFSMEQIMLRKTYPCRHTGCSYQTTGATIRKHEESCWFRPLKCPLNDQHEFSAFNLYNHITNFHKECLAIGNTVRIAFSGKMDKDLEQTYFLKQFQQLFKVCFKYNRTQQECFWEVQLVGPQKDQESKYQFELEIVDSTENGRKLYARSVCARLSSKEETFASSNYYVSFSKKQLKKLILNQLIFRVLICTKV